MITAHFSIRQDAADITITGHAGYADPGEDIVCAAVSSAAYLAANTVTEVLHVSALASDADGSMRLAFENSVPAADIARGLRLHLQNLQAQYPDFIKVT